MNARRVVQKADLPAVMMVAKFEVSPDRYIKCSFEKYRKLQAEYENTGRVTLSEEEVLRPQSLESYMGFKTVSIYSRLEDNGEELEDDTE
ncbi:gp0.9 [Bacillus phage SPO1]|uniref:Gp0.9 n=1 Tax=Bacillus phage SP01 TaxID=2884427 RepID=B6V2Y0_BPSP1|nr:gp0.9 [Bacillus phage SPO1]ACI90948.1 gp0.9 [Bacillus phage SPO1]